MYRKFVYVCLMTVSVFFISFSKYFFFKVNDFVRDKFMLQR